MSLLDNVNKLDIKKELETVPNLIAVYLFGSVASETTHSSSDVDFALLAEEKLDPLLLFDLKHTFSKRLHTSVDMVDLRRVSPVFGIEVLRSGRLLLSKDDL